MRDFVEDPELEPDSQMLKTVVALGRGELRCKAGSGANKLPTTENADQEQDFSHQWSYHRFSLMRAVPSCCHKMDVWRADDHVGSADCP